VCSVGHSALVLRAREIMAGATFCTEVQLLGFQTAPTPESGLGTEGRKNLGGGGDVCLISREYKN